MPPDSSERLVRVEDKVDNFNDILLTNGEKVDDELDELALTIKELYVFSSFKSASISLFYRFSCSLFLKANFRRFDLLIAFSDP